MTCTNSATPYPVLSINLEASCIVIANSERKIVLFAIYLDFDAMTIAEKNRERRGADQFQRLVGA